MADDFRNDPDYKQTRRGILGSGLKTLLWGATAVGATVWAFSGIGTIPALIVGAGALFTAYKSWSSHKDGEMAQAEVTAQRTAHHIQSVMQRERAASIAQMREGEQDTASANWQKTVAQRSQAQTTR